MPHIGVAGPPTARSRRPTPPPYRCAWKPAATRQRRVAAVLKATKEWNARHSRPAKPVVDSRVGPILDELRGMGSEKNRAGMARYGINVDNAFGVSVYELRKIAKRLGRDHDLALALGAIR